MRKMLVIGQHSFEKAAIEDLFVSELELAFVDQPQDALQLSSPEAYSVVLIQYNTPLPISQLLSHFSASSFLCLLHKPQEKELVACLQEPQMHVLLDYDNKSVTRVLLKRAVQDTIQERSSTRVLRIINSLILNFPAQVLITRYLNQETPTIIYANDAWLDFQHTKLSKIMGKAFDYKAAFHQKKQQKDILNDGSAVLYSVTGMEEKSRKGHKHWFDVWVLKLTDPLRTNLHYHIILKLDQTRHHLHHSKLRQQTQESITQAKQQEEFLAFTAHEIRKPLNNIVGLIEILRQETNPKDRERILSSLEHSAGGLGRLINDLLDLARLRSGEITLSPDIFNLHEMLQDLIHGFKHEAHQKSIDISLHLPDNVPVMVNTDEQRLYQVLTNLLGNALKFTEKGSISLTAALVNQGKQPKLRFTIRDTGIGIEKSKLNTIFKSFKQANTSIGFHFGGTGLGLHICKTIVELMKGEIQVESTLGKGTTFILELPIVLDTLNQPLQQIHDKDLKGLEVLVVDDNEVNRVVIEKLLKSWNAKVWSTASGQDAIDQFAKNPMGFVLMDIQMPGMNGIEASKILRQKMQHGQEVPILGLSAFMVSDTLGAEMDLYVDALLHKPLNAEDLYQKIHFLHEVYKRKNTIDEGNDMQDYRIIDAQKIRDFAGEDQVFMQQMIEIFLKRTPEYMQDLKTAIDQKNWQKIKMYAHKLKPTFSYVGMESFTERVGEIEDYAIKQEIMAILDIMDDVWHDCQIAFDEFKHFLAVIKKIEN